MAAEDMELVKIPMDALLQTPTPHSSHRNESFDAASRSLVQAFERDGMAYLHFGENSVLRFRAAVDGAFKVSRQFFSQSVEQKRTLTPVNLPPGVSRGYVGVAEEGGGEATELKEAFSWSVGDNAICDSMAATERWRCSLLEHENVWPVGSIEMQANFEGLLALFQDIMFAVARSVAHGCGSNNSLRNLEQQCRDGLAVSFARALHYLPQSFKGGEGDCDGDGAGHRRVDITGSAAHTDWGLATLVLQEKDSCALQALRSVVGCNGETEPGVWQTVRGMRDTLVVNCSDYVALASGGRLKSPVHRVVLTEQRRFSFVYFQYPPFDTPFPVLGSVPKNVVQTVSLLKNQRPGGAKGMTERESTSGCDGDRDAATTPTMSFGNFIVCKWNEVSRTVQS